MKWRKLGMVYAPDGSPAWAASHAHLPTPYVLDSDRIRVFFAALDENQFGRVTYVDVSASDPSQVVAVSGEVALDLGEPGTFDGCGVVPSCLIALPSGVGMYYVGFQRTFDVPYMLFSGLAMANPELSSFSRWARVPVLDRTAAEPFSRGAPYVINENGRYRMWYWSCTEWTKAGTLVHYNNVIRHAASTNGIEWEPSGGACLSPAPPDEYAMGRPCVLFERGIYRMWYSVRSHSRGYGIGYAESADGLRWERMDREAGLEVSRSGWDAEMVCYPAIVTVSGHKYLFYNGNRHGRTGFGCAVLDA